MPNVSLRAKIFVAMALVALLMGAAFVTVDYHQRRQELLAHFQQFVRSVAGTSALTLGARDLDRIHTNDDTPADPYRRSRAVLDKSRRVNELGEEALYVIRPLDGDCTRAEFVISLQSDRVVGNAYDVGDSNRAAILAACRGAASATGIYTDGYGSFISGYAPVLRDDGATAAVVEVDIDVDQFLARARRDLLVVSALAAAAFLVAMVPGLLLSRYVTRGLNRLSAALRRFQAGEANVQVNIRSRFGQDEVAHLGQAFNEMIVSVGEKLAMLPYVSRLTADAVRRSRTDPSWLTGSEHQAVVLFADLRGFTSFSESREAGQVVRELNQLLSAAADAVLSSGGDVDKFVGDCIMAVFIDRPHEVAAEAPAPDGGTAAAGRGNGDAGDAAGAKAASAAAAVRCAGKMILHVDREARAHGWALAMGVGIHCGPVLVGSIGSEARRDFTAIGHTVNLASRLCGKAAGAQVLVSEDLFAALAPDARARFTRTENLVLKNVSQTVAARAWDVGRAEEAGAAAGPGEA